MDASSSYSVAQSTTKKNKFNEELCHFMLSCDTPLNKVNMDEFKSFMKKNTEKNVPDQSTLRKYNVSESYKRIVGSLQKRRYGWKS